LKLDIPTLMAALMVGFLLLALQLWVAQRGALRQPELQRWSQGCWAVLAGFVFLPARLLIPEWISVLVGNCLLIVGTALFVAALYRHILDRALPAWMKGLCAGSCLLVLGTLELGTAERSAIYSMLYAGLLAPGLLLLVRHGWSEAGSLRTATVALGLTVLTSLARGLDAWSRPQVYANFLGDDLAQGLAYMMGFMCLMGAGFGFVLACFERVAKRMEEMATIDGLTACTNRSTTEALLAHSLERGRREGSPVAFALLDLDHFKLINDSHGHVAGDAALCAFAAEVRSRLRSSDVLGRMGGEEFGLLLPATDGPGAQRLLEQVREAVAQLVVKAPDGQRFGMTVSTGVVVAASDSGLTASRVYMKADRALYRAKAQGRNRVVLGGTESVTQLVPPQLVAVAGAGPDKA